MGIGSFEKTFLNTKKRIFRKAQKTNQRIISSTERKNTDKIDSKPCKKSSRRAKELNDPSAKNKKKVYEKKLLKIEDPSVPIHLNFAHPNSFGVIDDRNLSVNDLILLGFDPASLVVNNRSL